MLVCHAQIRSESDLGGGVQRGSGPERLGPAEVALQLLRKFLN